MSAAARLNALDFEWNKVAQQVASFYGKINV
jgi:hypothetical protein